MPHLWLILAAVIGGLLVGIGIIWEAWRDGHLWALPTACVFFGVIMEAAATRILFQFDEGISLKQKSDLSVEQRRTACIEQAAAWRFLKPEEAKILHDEFAKLPHHNVQLWYIMFDPESLTFGGQFQRLFVQADWNVDVRAVGFPGAAPFGVYIPNGDNNDDVKAVHRAFGIAHLGSWPLDFPSMANALITGVNPPPPFTVSMLVASKPPPFMPVPCEADATENRP